MKTHSWRISASRAVLTKMMEALRSNDAGSTVPVYAAGLLVLATASGAALSINHRTSVMTELQAASDAAALAATSTYADLKTQQTVNNLSDSQIEQKAKDVAKSVYSMNAKNTGIVLHNEEIDVQVIKNAQDEVTAVSTSVSPEGDTPVFMGGFLADSFKMKARAVAEARKGIGNGTSVYTTTDLSQRRNLEVVLVLDITGSMSGRISGDDETKIVGMRKAVKAFVNGIYGSQVGSTDTPPSNIKIGIIPYSNSVNVGKMLTSDELAVPAGLENWVTRNDSKGWKGCIVERSTTPNLVALDAPGSVVVRADALDVRDAPMATTPEKWTPYYNDPVELYQRSPNNVNKGLSRVTSNWFKPNDFSSARAPLRLVRNSVSEYWRPDAAAPAATEARDSNGNAVARLTATSAETGGGSPNSGCVPAALPLGSGYTKKRIGDYVDALSPSGWTHSNIGMAWANRMLSPWGPISGAQVYGHEKTDKLIVLMTDGYITAGDLYGRTNNSSSDSKTSLLKASSVQNPAGYFRVDDETDYDGYEMSSALYYNAYGLSVHNRLVGTQVNGQPNSNASGHILAHQQRLLMACKVARQPDGYTGTDPATKVYTVLFGFELPSGARNIYEECATVPSYALTADSSQRLVDAFARIADQSKLQLTE